MAPPAEPFSFSRKSRTGALVLLGLLILATVIWRLLPAWQQPQPDKAELALQQQWAQFKKEQIVERQPAADNAVREERYDEAPGSRPLHLQPFDPNTAGEAVLTGLGLPLHTARTLIKYRSKGGRFRKKEDLQKLYTLSREDYERIAPYVQIPGAAEAAEKALPDWQQEPPPAPAGPLELNGADAEALIALKGIGPGYSRRILKYRNALGGFVAVAQLKEVYGFPDSTYQQLKDQLTIDPQLVRRINVNTATEEELARHPYVGKQLATGIFRLRNDLKSFAGLEQLRQVPLINEEKYRKIAPYLAVR